MRAWVPDKLDSVAVGDARAELVTRWLRSFGPATVADLRWWTGWTLGVVRTALAASAAVEVDLDGSPGVALADDLEAVKAPRPWVALLPALDVSVMGWQARSWFLGDHAPKLFDRSGNAGPTVWSKGRVVGGWAQRKGGEIVFRLFADVGKSTESAIEREAERLQAWLGVRQFTPRFRTPLERELTA